MLKNLRTVVRTHISEYKMKPSITLKCLLHVNYTYKASLFHSFSLVKKRFLRIIFTEFPAWLRSGTEVKTVKSKRQQPIGNEMVTVPWAEHVPAAAREKSRPNHARKVQEHTATTIHSSFWLICILFKNNHKTTIINVTSTHTEHL